VSLSTTTEKADLRVTGYLSIFFTTRLLGIIPTPYIEKISEDHIREKIYKESTET